MAKDTEIDVLARVLQDAECNRLLYEGLQDELKKNPAEFYKNFVEPRSGKLKELADGIVTRMTLVQEVALMSKATAPKEEDNADKASS